MEFIAAPAKAPALGHVPAGLAPGRDFSFESIADEALIELGDLICSSHMCRGRASVGGFG
jgi:hypothetical protein